MSARAKLVARLACVASLGVGASCDLAAPSPFGAVCAVDATCGALFCVDNRCVTERPPGVEGVIHGLSCADPVEIVLTQDQATGLFAGVVELPAAIAATTACADAVEGGAIASIVVPSPMSVRVRASSIAKRTLAVHDGAGDTCGPPLDHACVENDGEATDVLLPLVEGALRIAVSSTTPVIVEVEQARCPPGFLPDREGCLGFVPIEGPGALTGHTLTAVGNQAFVAGGVDPAAPDVRSRDLSLFDPATLSFSERALVEGRTDHAAAAVDDSVVILGGTASNGVFGDERHTLVNEASLGFGFSNLGQPPPDSRHLTLTSLSGTRPLLFVGPGTPATATFDLFVDSEPCDAAGECDPGFECFAVLEDDPFGSASGLCLCTRPSCDPLELQLAEWAPAVGDLGAVTERSGHVAVPVESTEGTRVFIAGGETPDGLAQASLFFGNGRVFRDRGDVVARRTELDAVGTPRGDAVLVGGVLDGAVTALYEVYRPLSNTVTSSGALAHPRRRHAVALLDDTHVIVIGGTSEPGDAGPALATTEIIDVVTGRVSAGPTLPLALAGHRAVRVATGDVLVVGGVLPADLERSAFVLMRIAPDLEVPVFDSDPGLPVLPGDTCAEPVVLPSAGLVEGDTADQQNDLDALAISPDCTGFASPGPDVFYEIVIPSGATLVAEVNDPDFFFDEALYLIDSCAPDACLAGADRTGNDGGETISFVNKGAASLTALLVVDGFEPGVNFSYVLEWTVTP